MNEKIIKMYTEDNMTLTAIAKEIGHDKGYVSRRLLMAGIKIVQKPRSHLDTSGKTQENKKYYVYKQGAKRRGYTFELTRIEFVIMLYGKCAYCGQEPDMKYTNTPSREHAHYITINSIDRVDNYLGYTTENTVSCCKKCNTMKSILGAKEFLEHVEKIYKYNEVK